MILLIWNIQHRWIHRDRQQIGGCQGLRGKGSRNCLMDKGFALESWKCLELLKSRQIEVMIAQYYECTKCYWIVHFKMVNSMFYEFHLSKLYKYTHIWSFIQKQHDDTNDGGNENDDDDTVVAICASKKPGRA